MENSYKLVEWPESQRFIGHADCYITMENSTSCFVPEDLFLEIKTTNKNLSEILNMKQQYEYLENLLRESIRKYISKNLIDTSENNPLKCNIILEYKESCRLSSLYHSVISKMWQDPSEGIIYFCLDKAIIEFDNLELESLIIVCKYINKID